jgi:hypothetical protein
MTRETAIGYYNRALGLTAADPAMAYRHVCSAVAVDPTLADGWAFLGAALSDMGCLPASCAAFRKALACPPGTGAGDLNEALRFKCLVQLGHRLIDNRCVTLAGLAEARRFTMAALCMDAMGMAAPAEGLAFAHTNMSLIEGLQGHPGPELYRAQTGFVLCPEPATELGLAFALLHNGRYADGLRHFDARFPHALPSYLNLPWPRWDGSRIGTLLIMCEQGLGDSLSMARFVERAAQRVDRVIFQVQPELLRLLARAFAYTPRVEVVPQDHVLPAMDAWCPVFSLPVALKLTDEEIEGARWSGLHALPVENLSWKRTDARLHVAVAWAGAGNNAIDPHRSIPFEALLPLCGIPGVALYSVQVGERAGELHGKGAAALVSDMSPWIRDASDTAGILMEMDAVVTCESFVGHLAGALGVRTLLLCSRLGRDWRSGARLAGKALWYPETEVIRQGDECAWGPVVAEAVRGLA